MFSIDRDNLFQSIWMDISDLSLPHSSLTNAHKYNNTYSVFQQFSVLLIKATGLTSFKLITAKTVKISLLGEAHYFHHKERLIECFQMRGVICLLHSSNAARCPTAPFNHHKGPSLWRPPTKTATDTCSLIIWRRFAKVHMKNMPPCSGVAMIGRTQCDRKKTLAPQMSFNKMKRGYWHKDLEEKELALMGIWSGLFLFWKSRAQRAQKREAGERNIS